MKADRESRLAALQADRPFFENEDGVIANGAGVEVVVLGPDLIRIAVCGSTLELPSEPGKAADGAISWLIDARNASCWTEGTSAGADITAPERVALIDCIHRAMTAVGEHVTIRA